MPLSQHTKDHIKWTLDMMSKRRYKTPDGRIVSGDEYAREFEGPDKIVKYMIEVLDHPEQYNECTIRRSTDVKNNEQEAVQLVAGLLGMY